MLESISCTLKSEIMINPINALHNSLLINLVAKLIIVAFIAATNIAASFGNLTTLAVCIVFQTILVEIRYLNSSHLSFGDQ